MSAFDDSIFGAPAPAPAAATASVFDIPSSNASISAPYDPFGADGDLFIPSSSPPPPAAQVPASPVVAVAPVVVSTPPSSSPVPVMAPISSSTADPSTSPFPSSSSSGSVGDAAPVAARVSIPVAAPTPTPVAVTPASPPPSAVPVPNAAPVAAAAATPVATPAAAAPVSAAPSTPAPSIPESKGVYTGGSDGKQLYPLSKIELVETELRGGLTKYTAYKIVTSSIPESVFRRFSDFVWLRETLERLFPGVFIPPIPPKQFLNNKEESFVAGRKHELQRFLNRIAQVQWITDSAPFVLFMTRVKGYEEGVKESNKSLDTRDANDTMTMFNVLFGGAMASTLADNYEAQVTALRDFLIASETKLKVLADSTRSIAHAFHNIALDMSKMNLHLHQLYNDEKGYSERPQPARFDIMEHMSQWHVSSKQLTTTYDASLANVWKYELQDVQALLQVIKARQDQVNKAAKATTTAKKWHLPETKVPNEKVEATKRAELECERKENALVVCITKLLLVQEIPRQWQDRVGDFRAAMSAFSREHLQFATQMKTTWSVSARDADPNTPLPSDVVVPAVSSS